MTADERIEKLLNRFGQTISDLPQSTPESYAYKWEHLENVSYTAQNWTKHNTFTVYYLNEYLCHLADVIDRMETALETAVRVTDCWTCQHKRADPLKCCDCTGAKQYYKIRDFMLHDQKETDNEQS